MVKAKTADYILDNDDIDLDLWLAHIQKENFPDQTILLIQNACLLAHLAGRDHISADGVNYLQKGLRIAELISDLKPDQQTLSASIIYPAVEYAELSLEDVEKHLDSSIKKLVCGVQRMSAVDNLQQHYAHKSVQIDNIRKMLLAMVDDVRIVLIKLAERLHLLRSIRYQVPIVKKIISQEAIEIYASLANRLGIAQIKWELEDRAFRYIDPDQYQKIAKGLNHKRVERDTFVARIVKTIQTKLEKNNEDNFEIYGRSKHIYSIYKKMQRKNVDLSKIYDVTAVRILVNTTEECYAVLSLVHTLWQALPEEFDDYIAQPKSNGYRSLHTAVKDPQRGVFEIQIRTCAMHQEAELGIAAHWLYKEGGQLKQASHERKIEWLRQVLAWQKEFSVQDRCAGFSEPEEIEERVYVFTPKGEVKDLPSGATVLDFAYSIHSEVGHRCRGAKINDKITPLNTMLNTGDRVEIMTAKQGSPSRDWLNNHLGYVKTARAKEKIHHWFKQQDFEKNAQFGRDVFEREVNKLRAHHADPERIAEALHYKCSLDFYAALGRGDLRRVQLISKLVPQEEKPVQGLPLMVQPKRSAISSDIHIQGVGNLMTHIAHCCSPMPGELIIGYITLTRGISIHKQNCTNIAQTSAEKIDRLIDVAWGNKPNKSYPAKILIEAYDKTGLLHDITRLLSQEKISLSGLSTTTDAMNNIAKIQLSLAVTDLFSLSKIIDKLTLIKNITHVQRLG